MYFKIHRFRAVKFINVEFTGMPLFLPIMLKILIRYWYAATLIKLFLVHIASPAYKYIVYES